MCKKDITTKRLEDLLVDSGLSQEKFADRCGLSLAALKNYISSEKPRIPNTESLLKICKAFSVSADWLLGLSDVRKPSAVLKGVVDFTGLSEDAVNAIVDPGNLGQCKEALSHLLIQDGFLPFLMQYADYLELADIENHNIHKDEDEEEKIQFDNERHTVTLPLHIMLDYLRQFIMESVSIICKGEILPVASYDQEKGWSYPRKESMNQRDKENK